MSDGKFIQLKIKLGPIRAVFGKSGGSQVVGSVLNEARNILVTEMPKSRDGATYTHFLLANTKTGYTYPVFKRKRSHTASAPGAFPAVDTGRLRQLIAVKVSGLEGSIGSTAVYAKYLEDGTKARPGNKGVAPRKLFKAALEQAAAKKFKDQSFLAKFLGWGVRVDVG